MDLRQAPASTHGPLCWELFGAREHDCSSSSCLSRNPLWVFCCIDKFSCFHQLCVSLFNSGADSRGPHLRRAITDLDQCSHTHTHTSFSASRNSLHVNYLFCHSSSSAVSAGFSKLLKQFSKCVKHAILKLFFSSLHLSPKERENGDCHWSWRQTEEKCWLGLFVQCCSAPDGLCVMQGKQKQAVLMRVRESSCVATEAMLKSLGLDTHADRVTAYHTCSALPERHRPTLICCN